MKTTLKQDLTTAAITPLFFRYASPSIISMLGLSLYILADTFFIANGIGELGLTALNIALPVFSLITGLGLLIGMGGATMFSIAKTEGDPKIRNGIFGFSLLLALPPSLLFMALGLWCPEKVASLLGASQAALPYTVEYGRVIMAFAPLFIVNQIAVAFVRNDGSPNLAMLSLLAGVAFNTVFDYVFIYITGWGMFGAALATGLAPLVGIMVLSIHFLRKKHSFGLSAPDWSPAWFGGIFRGGSASFITELAGGIVIFCFNAAMLKLLGDLGVAAYGIIANISIVCIAVFTGLGQGMQPLLSSNYGAGLQKRCRKILYAGLGCAFALALLIFTMLVISANSVVGVFNGKENVELARIAADGIPLYFFSLLFSGLNIVVISYYQALLASRFSVTLSLIRGLLGILAGLFLLPRFFGVAGVWLTVPFAEILTFLMASFALVFPRLEVPRSPAPAALDAALGD